MIKVRISVGSVTTTMKLRKLLTRAKIPSRLIKLNFSEDHVGCTNGVEIYERDFYSAVMIMRDNGIAYKLEQNHNDLP